LAKISCIAGLIALLWWILSARRQEEILVRRVSCSPLPWFYFFFDHAPFYDRNELYLPASNGNGIGIVQMCSNARKWLLFNQLVDNHRDYARIYGHEYDLVIDGVHGVWDKIFILLDKLGDELAKPAPQRLEWLWYADVDTFIVNPKIRLNTILPPSDRKLPFILITSKPKSTLHSHVLTRPE
jgi:hypothetical protein